MHKKLAMAPTESDFRENDIMKLESFAKLEMKSIVATKLR